MIRKSYIDSPVGQLHVRENARVGGNTLVCLHATAYSGRSFNSLLAALDNVRHVIAVDMPGYGQSESIREMASIADYADAISWVIDAPVDLFGYHTGAYIAAEMAIRHPSKVSRLVMMGVPYFQALDFNYWQKKLAKAHRLSSDLGQFEERWDYLVQNRPFGLSLERGFENFVDELLAWPYGSRAHQALFAYDSNTALRSITQPCLILNPQSHLSEASAVAARLIPNCKILDMPNLNGAVLDAHADEIKRELENFLHNVGASVPEMANEKAR